ncbi:hypothetical protein HD554DRAFT_2042809 [Boletus coccyginus]|nr:hypothetical protein HD554DRAFT_2042809 [Boletus coccyginus]
MASNPPTQPPSKGKGWAISSANTNCGGWRDTRGQQRGQLCYQENAVPVSQAGSLVQHQVEIEDSSTSTTNSIKVAGQNLPAGTKATGHTKKDISVVIAKHLFKHNQIYEGKYAASTSTDSLKKKYRVQSELFKKTGQGIEPGHPDYTNLLRRTFNSAPTIDRRADFLNIIQHNQSSQQVRPGLSTEDDLLEAHPLGNPDDTHHRDDMAGDVPANDEEHCEYDFSIYDDEDSTWANVGKQVEEDEIMDSEEQDVPDIKQDIVMTAPGNQRKYLQLKSPFILICILHFVDLAPVIHQLIFQSTELVHMKISTKGKSTQQMVAEIKDQVSVLDESSHDQYEYANEWYSMKIQAHMHDKEIAYLQVEKEAKRLEADQIHQCQLEQKKADLNLLDKERDILSLKVCLVELGHLPAVNSSAGLFDFNFPPIPKHG